ncbi:MAG: hypothetical protein QF754_19550 [Alphaproteobacteria bacterium]|nr:hypothetical protein [Alphaproteobacteria bacterium]
MVDHENDRREPDEISAKVKIGSTFRSASLGAFGTPSRSIWEVVGIFRTADGLHHARLIDNSDRNAERTVAVDALLDKKLYQRAN